MQFRSMLLMAFGVFLCLQAGAISAPQPRLLTPVFEDTTLKLIPVPAALSGTKMPGFFGRPKNKFLVFALRKPPEGSSGSKQTLGWISIGMFALGVALFPLGAGAATIILIPLGIITGIIALAMKGDKDNRNERRRSRLPAIIGVVLGVGLIVGLAIAFGNSSWH